MFLASTAVCCDEAMKLVTCLGILAFTYLYKKRKEGTDGGGAYSQLSMGENNGTDVVAGDGSDEEDVDQDIEESNGVDNHVTEANNHESFRDYLREQLQFDFRMAGLAGIYTVQKRLLYVAISNLDAAVFQVTYQTKILTTALFSVILLKRKLGRVKIIGLLILTLGVAVVQLDKVEENASKSSQEQHRWLGVFAVLGACCTSGET